MSKLSIIFLLIFSLSGCQSINTYERDPSSVLSTGIILYEDGDYLLSMKYLSEVIHSKESSRYLKVEAYKYSAFIHCLSGRTLQCHESFKHALVLNPNFKLKPTEAGHPIWGPVYKQIKIY